MDDLLNWQTLLEVMLGISLSAAAGFRVFVPLLALSAMSVLGHVDLPTQFDWVETPQALGLFSIACVLEVIGYFVPWLDHALDLVATPAAIAAGTLMSASLVPEMNPLAQWTLALVAGGGTAGITKLLTNLIRGTSTATSGGLANPLWALVELVGAIGLSVLGFTVPVLAGGAVIGLLGFGSFKLWQFLSGHKLTEIRKANPTTIPDRGT
ncbi:DUF4126 domain-containing protein [Phormidium tenue FACHB-886]|nr:DUF4126 domain-containing protein [Phormidium tenue FACHB-886]